MKSITDCLHQLKRQPNANKSHFGHVLVLGGDYGMGGAALLAAEAASRLGAGKVSVFTRTAHISALLARLPHVMSVPANRPPIDALADKSVLVIGTGLGSSDWSQQILEAALSFHGPQVWDADALNALAEDPSLFKTERPWILTPHPGEAARLLNQTTYQIQANRQASIEALVKKFPATWVLKGQNTLVYGPSQSLYTCPAGNPGMATAGMGDVLSGTLGALLAQGLTPDQAARLGVYLHAKAADLLVADQGEIGLFPQELPAKMANLIHLEQLANGDHFENQTR
jgi:hydroxyethylthiazole kinase-like uncharacterized protein yjeF